MSRRYSWLVWLLGGVLLALGMTAVSHMDLEALDAQQAQYCRMVEAGLHDPDTGWPDYAGTYMDTCPQARAQAAR